MFHAQSRAALVHVALFRVVAAAAAALFLALFLFRAHAPVLVHAPVRDHVVRDHAIERRK